LENQRDDLIFQRGDTQAELKSLMNRIADLDQQLSEKEKEKQKQNREFDIQCLCDKIYEKRKELQQLRAQSMYWYY
jgi:predicted SprT family Zn-dependent metalloprotease